METLNLLIPHTDAVTFLILIYKISNNQRDITCKGFNMYLKLKIFILIFRIIPHKTHMAMGLCLYQRRGLLRLVPNKNKLVALLDNIIGKPLCQTGRCTQTGIQNLVLKREYKTLTDDEKIYSSSILFLILHNFVPKYTQNIYIMQTYHRKILFL